MNRHGTIRPERIQQDSPGLANWVGLLLVGRGDASAAGLDPDLQQPAGNAAPIYFAVPHPAAGAHALHLTGPQHLGMAQRVAMVELAFHHHGDDFHVAVGMHPKAAPGGNGVVVDHPQGPKPQPGRVVVA